MYNIRQRTHTHLYNIFLVWILLYERNCEPKCSLCALHMLTVIPVFGKKKIYTVPSVKCKHLFLYFSNITIQEILSHSIFWQNLHIFKLPGSTQVFLPGTCFQHEITNKQALNCQPYFSYMCLPKILQYNNPIPIAVRKCSFPIRKRLIKRFFTVKCFIVIF